ncbi:MAG: metallophosphoesterase, partial [Candidatus Goldbacteria bacterium]|nr:metallophosphoesterase [Candidatus Goldiibacteriota bacterium]
MKKIFFILLSVFIYVNIFCSIIRTPYLQSVTQNSIYVLVECDSTDDVTVEYGLTQSYGNSAVTESMKQPETGKWVHRIKLTGLIPNTQYHYRATQDGLNYTSDYVFRTAAMPGQSFRMAIVGDMRSNPTIWNKIAGHIISYNPAFTIHTGDLCVDGSYSAWNNEYFTPNNMILSASVPWFNALGNHEGWTTATQAFIKNPDSDSGNETYYSFDYGDFHFAVMNNYGAIPYGVGSTQANWIYGDLTTTSKPWKVVVFHVHGYGASSGHGEDATMIDITTNIFEPAGVDFTLAGHSHMYQHNIVNSIHHFIIGGGGAPLHDPINMPYTIFSDKSWGFAIADCNLCEFNMTQYNDDATPIETVIINRCTLTLTDTNTATITETIIETITPTITPTISSTLTYTISPTLTQTEEWTDTCTPTLTHTDTESPTYTDTPTEIETWTHTFTCTITDTDTETETYTVTLTPTPTITRTHTAVVPWPTDVVAVWNFDARDGTDSVNGYDLIEVGEVTYDSGMGYGGSGYSVTNDNKSDNYFIVPVELLDYLGTQGEFTIECRIRPPAKQVGGDDIMGSVYCRDEGWPHTTYDFMFNHSINTVWNPSWTGLVCNGDDNRWEFDYEEGRWYRLTISWDGNYARAYIDGVKINEIETNINPFSGDNTVIPFNIMRFGPHGYKGHIDQIVVSKKDRGGQEIMPAYTPTITPTNTVTNTMTNTPTPTITMTLTITRTHTAVVPWPTDVVAVWNFDARDGTDSVNNYDLIEVGEVTYDSGMGYGGSGY